MFNLLDSFAASGAAFEEPKSEEPKSVRTSCVNRAGLPGIETPHNARPPVSSRNWRRFARERWFRVPRRHDPSGVATTKALEAALVAEFGDDDHAIPIENHRRRQHDKIISRKPWRTISFACAARKNG